MTLRRTISPKLMPRRPQEIRRIRIGGKGEERTAKGGAKYRVPVKYDHFIVSRRVRGDDDNFETDATFHEQEGVGPEPTELRCRLMYPTPEENFRSHMVIYDGKTRTRQCDGEQFVDQGTGEVRACQYGECKCKPYGHLTVMLDGLDSYGGFAGFRTTSFESINNIQTALEDYHRQFGTLAGIPFKLVLYEREVEKGTAWSVAVVIDATPEEARRVARELLELHIGSQKLALPPIQGLVEEIDELEAADIEEEFFPPEGAGDEEPGPEASGDAVDQAGPPPDSSPRSPGPADVLADGGREDPGAGSPERAALRMSVRLGLEEMGIEAESFWEYMLATRNLASVDALDHSQLLFLVRQDGLAKFITSFKASPFYKED